MSRKELDKLDDKMAHEFGAECQEAAEMYVAGRWPNIGVRIYQSPNQRIVATIIGDKWTIYTHHESGGAS